MWEDRQAENFSKYEIYKTMFKKSSIKTEYRVPPTCLHLLPLNAYRKKKKSKNLFINISKLTVYQNCIHVWEEYAIWLELLTAVINRYLLSHFLIINFYLLWRIRKSEDMFCLYNSTELKENALGCFTTFIKGKINKTTKTRNISQDSEKR